jgi:uncharacterized membrane protein YbhN (UPF0104 family)
MKEHRKRWWPVCKALLTVAILVAVGWQLVPNLTRLDITALRLRPTWLLLSALLYLAGLGCCGWFWYRLLITFGQRPRLGRTFRAYYISHLGKYVPGKALSLAMRGGLIQSPEVKLGVAVIAAFYEVLTTMAAGALLAAMLFAIYPPRIAGLDWNPVYIGLLLLGLFGVPLLPAVFNRLVKGLAARFQKVESFRLPDLREGTLLQGLLYGAMGWLLLGLSLWALLQSFLPELQEFSLRKWAVYTAMVSLSCVAGFLVIVSSAGLGVRESILDVLLPGEIDVQAVTAPEPVAAATVILLRVVWTLAELVIAAALYWWGSLAGKSTIVEQAAAGNDMLAAETSAADVVQGP